MDKKYLGNALSTFGSGLRDLATAGGIVGISNSNSMLTNISIVLIISGGIIGVLGKSLDMAINGPVAPEPKL